jgi:N utilization substance protein B
MKPRSRHNARKNAIQALYQWQLGENEPSDIIDEFGARQNPKKVDIEYFKELVLEISQEPQKFDARIQEHASRTIEETDPIELAILRVAIYELSWRLDVPYRVVINEALELTKTFGGTDGHKFVNQVLDQAAKTLRKEETKNEI